MLSTLVLILEYIRIAVIVVFLIIILSIIVFLTRTNWLKYAFLERFIEFFGRRPYHQQKFLKKWENIMKRLGRESEEEYKLAIIEADEILEKILDQMKFEGETTRERLTKVPKLILDNLEEVKKAHETRDNIVHDPDYRIEKEEAERVLKVYEKALKQLDV